MTKDQAAKMTALDREMQAEHKEAMYRIDPLSDPSTPAWVRILDTPYGPGF